MWKRFGISELLLQPDTVLLQNFGACSLALLTPCLSLTVTQICVSPVSVYAISTFCQVEFRSTLTCLQEHLQAHVALCCVMLATLPNPRVHACLTPIR